jgi:hypothetical protein
MTASQRLIVVAAVLASGALGAVPAHAATVLTGRLASADSEFRRCHDRLAPGAAGVVTRRAASGEGGFVSARLSGPARSDWDLAVFDARSKRLVAASAGPASTELAQGFVGPRRELVVQACRLRGGARRVGVTLSTFALDAARDEGEIQLVRVVTRSAEDKRRLQALGLDLTEHAGPGFVEVVLHGTRDANLLRSRGFTFTVEIADLVARRIDNARKDASYVRATTRSALPSGRTTYRRLADYEADLKRLAVENPGLVKLFTLPNASLEGRAVMGVEITRNVNVEDGKPVFLNMGVHHAREWPSGEHAMEWAFEIVTGFRAGDERVTRLLDRARTIVVPVVNVDGFNLSREALVDTRALGDLHPLGYTATLLADQQVSFAYKRRNCRVEDGRAPEEGECAEQGNRMLGVDPNRNYGALWGGPGADSAADSDIYRGASPFSEPETRNVQQLVSSKQVTVLITNHTFSNLVLRPPGVRAQGPPPDEAVFKALGARMTRHNGYTNQKGYELYDTTGTTEDWSYAATGGLGYTFEIGPEEFHPPFAEAVAEYEGKDGLKGNREAYFEAFESTADEALHSVIEGRAPAGSTIRLRKEFLTSTSPVIVDTAAEEPETGPAITFPDRLDTTMTVPASGAFRFHANPSTRPVVASNRYFEIAEQPSKVIAEEDALEPTVAGGGAMDPPHSVEIPFELPASIPEGDRYALRTHLEGSDGDDYDIYLFRELEGGGRQIVGSSASSSAIETILVEGPATGRYVLKVVNWLATNPAFSYRIETYARGKEVVRAGSTEAWNVSCERDGQIVDERKVVVGRGERADLGAVCSGPAAPGTGTGSFAVGVVRGTIARGTATRSAQPLRYTVGFRSRRLRRALRRGLVGRATCSAACTMQVALRLDRKTARRLRLRTTVGRARLSRSFTGTHRFRLRFDRRAARRLARRKAVRLSVVATVRSAAGVRQASRSALRLRR